MSTGDNNSPQIGDNSRLSTVSVPEVEWGFVYEAASVNTYDVLPTNDRDYADPTSYNDGVILRKAAAAMSKRVEEEIGKLEEKLGSDQTKDPKGETTKQAVPAEVLFAYASMMKVKTAMDQMAKGAFIPEAIGLDFYELYLEKDVQHRRERRSYEEVSGS